MFLEGAGERKQMTNKSQLGITKLSAKVIRPAHSVKSFKLTLDPSGIIVAHENVWGGFFVYIFVTYFKLFNQGKI